MSSANNRPILIAGAGLGGLAAAVALLQRGFQVAIFEKSSELREVGAGLSIWPNATRVLKELGLLDAALGQSKVIQRLRLMTWRGKRLSEVAAVHYETPAICIHRADLMAILKTRVPRECLHLGEKLVGFDEKERTVMARFASGHAFTGGALIGADGIQSAIRTQIQGESKPAYRGYQAWRGVAHALPGALHTLPSGTAFEFWGYGKRVGVWPLSEDRMYWYAAVNAPQGALGDPASWKDEARQLFHDWVSPVPELIESTDPSAILKHEIEDRLPARPWGRGRVTLLGDAAHLTTPNLCQGACMAFEDALVLARSLSENDMDISARLRRYESLRYDRTAFLTREARKAGWVGQLNNGFAVGLRTCVLRMIPAFLSEMRHRQYFSFEN